VAAVQPLPRRRRHPLDVRAAGALLLLYGQFVTRIVCLTTADLRHDGHDTYLHAGAAPVLLPPKVAAVICAQRDAGPARITYRHPSQEARPLVPGRRHGQHLGAEALTRRLRQHGIEPRQARNQALVTWAAELPAPVLADILGLHVTTAEQWAQRARRDWTSYIAERAGDMRA